MSIGAYLERLKSPLSERSMKCEVASMGVRFTLWAVDAEQLLDALTADEVSAAWENSLLLQIALRRVSKSS